MCVYHESLCTLLQEQFTIITIIMAHINYHPRVYKRRYKFDIQRKNSIIVVKHIDPSNDTLRSCLYFSKDTCQKWTVSHKYMSLHITTNYLFTNGHLLMPYLLLRRIFIFVLYIYIYIYIYIYLFICLLVLLYIIRNNRI